jgi:3-phenylpropionate/trans-cinnamate dioxygenase ferredoxin reductase subunit
VRPVVTVVGNGVAGYACARRLAELGAAPVMIGPGLPHDRPPLSKRALELGRAPLLADQRSLVAQGIHHVDGMVDELDLRRRTLTITPAGGGKPMHRSFDRLVWATGLRPVAPPVPGIALAYDNSTAAGMLALAAAAKSAKDVVVIGAGLIGCETAATLAGRRRVTLLDRAHAPVERLGATLSRVVGDALRDVGVRFLGGCTIRAVSDGGVETASHGHLPCDATVVAAGVRSTVPPALGDRHIDVDQRLRAIGLNGVWACGDVTRFPHPRYGRMVVPHWDNARAGGHHVAESVMGSAKPYIREPYWFSDIGALRVQQLGLAEAAVDWRQDAGMHIGVDSEGRPTCVLLIDAPRMLLAARSLLAA